METEDEEIDVLRSVVTALARLDEQARIRVMAWVSAKFNIPTPKIPVDATPKGPPLFEPVSVAESPTGTDLPSLFGSVTSRTESEKALVVAAWLQTSKSQDSFDSQEVNRELKHLGHGVKNITRALEALISSKPQLVIQTRKSGTSKQARKRYRVTSAGLTWVTQNTTKLDE